MVSPATAGPAVGPGVICRVEARTVPAVASAATATDRGEPERRSVRAVHAFRIAHHRAGTAGTDHDRINAIRNRDRRLDKHATTAAATAVTSATTTAGHQQHIDRSGSGEIG